MVFTQRKHPGFKGHLQPGWDLINRWEELEPIEHRRPIPVSLSDCYGWIMHGMEMV